MAKKKDKKKDKKEGAAKLPKRIAGVKVPKQLRAGGGKLMEAVRNPLVIDLAAGALLAAAARLYEGKAARRAGGAADDAPAAGSGSGPGPIVAATALEGVRKRAGGAARSGGDAAGGAGPRRAAKPNARA